MATNGTTFALLILLCLSLHSVCAAQPAAVDGDLYAALRTEFAAVGEARFIAGNTPDETLDRIGGGETIAVEGQPFARARRVKVDIAQPGNMWAVHVSTTSTQPVRKGEVLLMTYYARGVKAPQKVDDGAGPVVGPLLWSKEPHGYVSWTWPQQEVTGEWERYWVVSESTQSGVGGSPHDYPAGQLMAHFNCGFKNQTIEIGGIAIMAFPADANLAALPKKDYDYPGRAADAPWRAEAATRIDRYRKGDLAVRVVDVAGKPVANAQVRVAMTRHAFGFGTAVTNGPLLDMGESASDGERYRAILKKYFNRVVFENELKWPAAEEWGEGFSHENTLRAAKWLKDNGFRIRGHALIYGQPKRVLDMRGDSRNLRAEVLRHIQEYVERYKGIIDDWDVTNETATNHELLDALGPEAMLDWYRAARAADSSLKLTYLEPTFGPDGMEGGSFPSERLPSYEGWVDYLVKNDAPLDYLGSQAHGGPVGTKRDGPAAVWATMDRMVNQYGKRLQYTELDVNITRADDPDALQYQADRLRDAMTIAFAHPAMDGITLWGFWERRHWFPNAALWRADWSIKPIGQAYVDLVTKTWWTDETVVTDADGRASVRGFLGSYELTATAGDGRTAAMKADLNDLTGGSVTIHMK